MGTKALASIAQYMRCMFWLCHCFGFVWHLLDQVVVTKCVLFSVTAAILARNSMPAKPRTSGNTTHFMSHVQETAASTAITTTLIITRKRKRWLYLRLLTICQTSCFVVLFSVLLSGCLPFLVLSTYVSGFVFTC